MAQYDVNWSARVNSAAGTVAVGDCLTADDDDTHYVGTTANRTSYGRCIGIAATAGDSTSPVVVIQSGLVPASITGLAAGSVSWVRVSSAGVMERVTPGSGDDIIGKARADGSVQLCPGVFDSDNYAGGGGGGTPGGSDGDLQTNSSGSFSGLSPGMSGNLCTSNGSAWTSTAPSFAASAIASGQLAAAQGGTAQDSSAWTGLAKVASGTWSALSLGSGVETWLGTPSGANLASALSSALTNAKGGTGQDSSAWTGLAQVSSGTWSALSLGTGVATMLGTFSSANIASACSDETGSGSLVFGTSPTLTTPTVTNTQITNSTSGGTIDDCTLSGTAGSVRRVRFTDVTGPTVTGFDATGVADGTILRVTAAGGTVAITHEGAGSTAANRCTLQGGITVNVAAGCFTMFEYDGTASRWRHLAATAI